MSGHCSVSCFSLHDVVTVDADRGHQAKRAEALSHDIGLHITVVVLAGPDETTVTLDNLSDDIIDESVLVPEVLLLVLIIVLLAVDSLEGVDKESIVLLEDSVLGGKLQREVSVKGVAEASAGESLNRLVCVEHAHVDTSLEVGDVLHDGLTSVLGGERDIDGTGLRDDVVLASVLVTESMSSNDDGLGPAWNAFWNVRDDNGLSEHGTVEDVSDSTVGTLPHLLKVELLNTALIGGNGGALDGNLMLFGSVGGINSDLVVGGVARGHREIVVVRFQVEVGVHVTLLDPLPDDAGHLITVHVDDRVGDLDLAERGGEVSLGCESGKHCWLE